MGEGTHKAVGEDRAQHDLVLSLRLLLGLDRRLLAQQVALLADAAHQVVIERVEHLRRDDGEDTRGTEMMQELQSG